MTVTVKPQRPKCVIVIARELPLGLALNTAACLGVTLGARAKSLVGADVIDASGLIHLGLTNIGIPILGADADSVKAIRDTAATLDGLLVIDFTDTAQAARDYQEYLDRMAAISSDHLRYCGVALYGPGSLITRLTGNLPLLRHVETSPRRETEIVPG